MFDIKKLWEHYQSEAVKSINKKKRQSSKTRLKNNTRICLQAKQQKNPLLNIRKSILQNYKGKERQPKHHLNFQQNKKYRQKYLACDKNNQTNQNKYIDKIKQIFAIIDQGSKGQINIDDITSINIPDKVLYFLGSIFQIIRTKRKKMNLKQFIQNSQTIFNCSSKKDINYFIHQLNLMHFIEKNNISNVQTQTANFNEQRKFHKVSKSNSIQQDVKKRNLYSIYQDRQSIGQIQQLDDKIQKLSNKVSEYIKQNEGRLTITSQGFQKL